jgi:hypothetical protein
MVVPDGQFWREKREAKNTLTVSGEMIREPFGGKPQLLASSWFEGHLWCGPFRITLTDSGQLHSGKGW